MVGHTDAQTMPHLFGMLMVVVTPAHVTSSVCWGHLTKENTDVTASWISLKRESRPFQVIQCFIK